MSGLSKQDQHTYAQHAPMVERLARSLGRRLPASVDTDDLLQDGRVALINAILGASRQLTAEHFRNYLALRVQGAMLDGLRALDHGSRQLRRDMRAVEQAIQKLGHAYGRAPSEQEVAEELGLPLRKYQRMLQEAADYSLISLEDLAPVGLWQVALEHHDANPLGVLERADLRRSLVAALGELPQKSQAVLRHYYVEDLKMHEIGARLQLTEARVSQIHAQAIAALRAALQDPSGAIPLLQPRTRTRRRTP